MEELLAKNKSMKSFVTSLKVKIRNTDVDLRHKFVLVPLVYNKKTCSCDFQEMEKVRLVGNSPMAGQSFNNFLAYNALVNKNVKKSYPKSCAYLVDPNSLLAMETLKTVKYVYGRSYNTVRYEFIKGNNPRNDRLMDDRTRQDYFVWLVRWVKDNFEEETRGEMALRRVPAKGINLRVTQYYNSSHNCFNPLSLF